MRPPPWLGSAKSEEYLEKSSADPTAATSAPVLIAPHWLQPWPRQAASSSRAAVQASWRVVTVALTAQTSMEPSALPSCMPRCKNMAAADRRVQTASSAALPLEPHSAQMGSPTELSLALPATFAAQLVHCCHHWRTGSVLALEAISAETDSASHFCNLLQLVLEFGNGADGAKMPQSLRA